MGLGLFYGKIRASGLYSLMFRVSGLRLGLMLELELEIGVRDRVEGTDGREARKIRHFPIYVHLYCCTTEPWHTRNDFCRNKIAVPEA